MPLPVVPNNTVCQMVFKGFTNQPADLENVTYWLYQVGLTPTPGGVTLDALALNTYNAWATLFATYMSGEAGYSSVTIRLVTAFVGDGGARYKVQATQLWSVENVQVGLVAGHGLPAFNAYSIEKRIAVAGRGRQGHVRVWGVPDTLADGDKIQPATIVAMNGEAFFSSPFFLVGGVGDTDNVALGVIDGKKTNTNPGLVPTAYFQPLQGLVLSGEVGSQITRKYLRRRRA